LEFGTPQPLAYVSIDAVLWRRIAPSLIRIVALGACLTTGKCPRHIHDSTLIFNNAHHYLTLYAFEYLW
jgi:hypothetical protein